MNPSRVVITGTIASGKSSLSDILRNRGFFVIDSDYINKLLLEKDGLNYKSIRQSGLFDDAFFGDKLDKNSLSLIIFNDEKKRKALNKISHKNIISYIDKMIDESNEELIFIEIPLFFQMEEKFDYDYIWFVKASKKVQIDRLMARDKIDENYAIKKINSQKLNYKEKKLDYIFDNSKDLKFLEKQVDRALKMLENLWK